MSIKIKLLELGKRQTDLLDELRKRGWKRVQQSELSVIINGKLTTPKADAVLSSCHDILKDWESEKKRKED